MISAPQPASRRHTEISPPAACVTSLQVQPWRSPRRLHLRFPHGSRTTHAQRTAEARGKKGEKKPPGRIYLRGLSPAQERGWDFLPSIHLLTDPLVVRACVRACVCVCSLGGVNPEFSKLENLWHIPGRSAAPAPRVHALPPEKSADVSARPKRNVRFPVMGVGGCVV